MQADGSYLAVWISGATIWGQGFNADGSHKDGQFQIASGADGSSGCRAPLSSPTAKPSSPGSRDGSTNALRLGANGAVIGTVTRFGVNNGAQPARPGKSTTSAMATIASSTRDSDRVTTWISWRRQTVIGATVTKVPVASANDFHHAFVVLGNETFIILYHNPNAIQLEDVTNLGETKYITRTDPSAPHNHSATALADSKFVVAWQDSATVGGDLGHQGAGVRRRSRSSRNGQSVSRHPPGDVSDLAVTQLSDGGFALLLTMNNGTDD